MYLLKEKFGAVALRVSIVSMLIYIATIFNYKEPIFDSSKTYCSLYAIIEAIIYFVKTLTKSENRNLRKIVIALIQSLIIIVLPKILYWITFIIMLVVAYIIS